MSDGAQLLRLVRGVRRRLQLRAAIAGATVGGALTLGAAELAAAGARLSGSWFAAQGLARISVLMAALLLGALVGGVAAAVLARRTTTLQASARHVDGRLAAERPGDPSAPARNGDRVRLALDLLPSGTGPEAAFPAAVVADAWRATGGIAPAQLAPWRRPPLLVALVAALALLWPVSRWTGGAVAGAGRAASAPGAAGSKRADRSESGQGDLQAARREVQALAELAGAIDDRELRALAGRLDAALAGLAGSEAGQASAEVAALVAEARAASREAREAAVRAGAEAGSGARSGAARGERPGGPGPIASGAAAGVSAEEERRQRRLNGLDDQAGGRGGGAARSPPAGGDGGPGESAEQDRQLRRLGRDLDPPSPPAEGGPASAGGGSAGGARERMARAEERIRRALGQSRAAGGQGSRPDQATTAALSEFERRARGGRGSGGAAAGGGDPAGAGAGQAAGPGGGDGVGQGNGSQSGRPAGAEGAGDPAAGAEGPQLEATLAEGSGPSRAQSIALGAGAGFDQPGYDRTYRAYRAAVEETLDLAAVPEGRQRLVRRYFELIRPRGK